MQAVERRSRSMDVLANAVYLGYIKVPIVESVAEQLQETLQEKAPKGDGLWIATMAVAFQKQGYGYESTEVLGLLFDEGYDPNEYPEIEEFLEENDDDLYRWWKNAGRIFDEKSSIN